MIQPEDVDRYSKLFVAIILQAVQDAGTRPNEDEKKLECNRIPEVVSAFEYLFGCDRDVFNKHAALIGADADQIREALLHRTQSLEMQGASVSPDKLRVLRIRYRWMKKNPYFLLS